ncbi:MAG TPA: galactonate dehydratase [Rhizomicrobium sp.]|jgi:galactonate dehydratase|nr:galactonate dehydratase [Rhizomicrobium sp.]
MKPSVSRRNWMKTMTAGMAGLLAAERAGHAAEPVSMSGALNSRALADPREPIKITKLEIIPVNTLRSIFVKMYTDAGIVGIGEGTVEGRIPTVMAAIKELEPYLVGKDPRQPAHHWQAIYRHAFYRGDIILTSALSAVDIAMWDIKGKALGVPVYELLGGPTRDRIRVYGQAESVEETKKVLAEGYTSMKTSVSSSRGRLSRYSENPDFIQGFVEKVGAIRELIGPKVDLGIEMHGDHEPQAAMQIIKALEKFQPWFFEEPIQFQNLPLMAEMAKKTTVPFATGERMVTKWQFRDLLTAGAASLLQPDITHTGGITEMKAIAALAESFYAAMLPHSKEGMVGMVASMHVSASIPNFLAHEVPSLQAVTGGHPVERSPLGKSYITKPLTMTEGAIVLKGNIDGPGLGIALDENLIDNERGVPEWEFPEMWDSFDGSVLDH